MRNQELVDRVKDLLIASGISDPDCYFRVNLTYNDKVQVVVYPHTYLCTGCRNRGFLDRAKQAFINAVRPTWCDDCDAMHRANGATRNRMMERAQKYLVQHVTLDSGTGGSILVTG